MTMTERRAIMQTGALLWIIGTLLVVLEPSLILFTIGLAVVGTVAIGAWILYTFFVLRDARRYHEHSRQLASKE
jgi:membrane-bound ClpP family serine protease